MKMGFQPEKFSPEVKRRILRNFDKMEEIARFLRGAIENEKKVSSEKIVKDTEGMSEEEKIFYHELESDYYFIENTLTQISFYSFIVILYSFIEVGMNALCNAFGQDKKIELSYKDLHGKGINRAKLYFEKVLNIKLSSGKSWSEVVALGKIRNAIVHNEGWPTKEVLDDQCIKKHIAQVNMETPPGPIVINASYLDSIISTVRKFFDEMPI